MHWQITLDGHVTPADKAHSDYRLVEFELPQPARRLQVQYRYSNPISSDQRIGGNVIDIGIFDPRGTAFPGAAGFRGWSGSAREGFTLAPADATPGYLPGPLPAGRYHIILGLYRIWERGADFEIQIEADLDPVAPVAFPPRPAARPARATGQGAGPQQWLRGDLQCHTEHSDAGCTLAELAAQARVLGLDFLAITDHNTVSHHAHLAGLGDDDLLLIPGQEVTTYYGHMNVWGTHRWCDFRCRTDADVAAVIDLAHISGGLCSINHPKTLGPEWEYTFDLPVDALEVWQGPWPALNEESLAIWQRLLREGRRLPAVGGSDYHCPAPGQDPGFLQLGQPTTWVKVTERSVPALLQAIRAGRVSISALPDGPRLDLSAKADGETAGMGDELAVAPGATLEASVDVTKGKGWTLRLVVDGAVAHETAIKSDLATVHAELSAGTYVYAELIGDAPPEILPEELPIELDLRGWHWALSNPVYMRRTG
jgi:hypothetical protein